MSKLYTSGTNINTVPPHRLPTNYYLKQFRKSSIFKNKQHERIAPLLHTLHEFASPMSLHAKDVLERWFTLVERTERERTDTIRGFSGSIYTREMWEAMNDVGTPTWLR